MDQDEQSKFALYADAIISEPHMGTGLLQQREDISKDVRSAVKDFMDERQTHESDDEVVRDLIASLRKSHNDNVRTAGQILDWARSNSEDARGDSLTFVTASDE